MINRLQMKEIRNCPLLQYNTFGMDVKADLFVEYESVEELKKLLLNKNYFGSSWLHIGGGSNLLFRGDYEGTVLHSAIRGYEIIGESDTEVLIRVGAGEIWDDFVAYTVKNHWYGAENLSLIPGEVGASAVQNIGAYGVEAKDLIVQVATVSVADGEERFFANEECRYAYRDSIFKGVLKGKYIVTHVTFRLGKFAAFHLEYGNIRGELEKKVAPLRLKMCAM